MTQRFYCNDGWEFTPQFSESFLAGEGQAAAVRLPHTCAETPYDYFDESIYQMVCGYRRMLEAPEAWAGKHVALTVGAAGHCARVYLDGELLAEHRCGYTAFTVDLTPRLRPGSAQRLVIAVDSRETLDQPPFGYVVDYMTYGGLYREVWLEVSETARIADVFARPRLPGAAGAGPQPGAVDAEVTLAGVDGSGYTLRQTLRQGDTVLARRTHPAAGSGVYTLEAPEVLPWAPDTPQLYTLETALLRDGAAVDVHTVRIGFREIEFRADGFYLNGVRTPLRGLNRHQSWPYVGYAMPAAAQRLDADILKKELGCNAVRTSHYPQSQHFIDRCDELGLLVFTEIPGWQHIGAEAWKAQALANVEEMVRQYRNHPSVILWGVRINESNDDDALYEKTNALCRQLDPTRPTGGVRCIKRSHLLEDVYTYNDFVHDGASRGCEPKRNVTSDMRRAYLISEYNGHMFPTKMFDSEYHTLEHALRHARVLDSIAGEKDIAGGFGWCMFDYNTHKDFGSGDRVCYHGVLDMYRNPKPAAAVYAAQQEQTPVLAVTSRMDIGEHPGGNMGRVYIITNAQSVRMYKNDRFIKEYFPGDSAYRHLRHGPILIDDYIGDALEEGEGYSPEQARLVRDMLNYSAVYGFSRLPPGILAKAARAMVRYRMRYTDAYRLYGKYIGSWGDSSVTYRFEAIVNGRVVKTVVRSPAAALHLEAAADHTHLQEDTTYDVATVRLTMCDQNGSRAPFFNGAVELTTRGPVALIGPRIVTLRGGAGGTYVKTLGRSGEATLTLHSHQAEDLTIRFQITAAHAAEEVKEEV